MKNNVLPALTEVWLQEYKGKSSESPISASGHRSRSPKRYTSCWEHKRLKLNRNPEPVTTGPDELDDYLATNIHITDNEYFDPIQYWNDRYLSQPDLAQFALDALAVPPMSDECERLFSSAKLLITDRRSCLKMDIIEANECLRAWFGRPKKGTFEDKDIGKEEGEVWEEEEEDGPADNGSENGGDVGDEDGDIITVD